MLLGINKQAAEREWHVWNHILFENELQVLPKFVFKRDMDDGDTEGLFQEDENDDDVCIIKISRSACLEDSKKFSIILIHEMVHQLQWERKLDVDHDEFFYEVCAQIKGFIELDVV